MKKDDRKQEIMQMYILAHMMKEVGRYIRFQSLNQSPLEEQYQIVKKIDSFLKEESKRK